MNYFPRFAARFAGSAIAVAVALLFSMPWAAIPAQAQTAQPAAQIPVVIGILDTQSIIFSSTAGKALTAQANANLKAMEDGVQKKEDGLRTQFQQLDTQRNANPPLSPADYDAKRKMIAAQDEKIRNDFISNKQALSQRVDKARQILVNAAGKVIQDIAKARGLTLILNRSNAELYPPQWDITDEVMQRLNKALPSVKL